MDRKERLVARTALPSPKFTFACLSSLVLPTSHPATTTPAPHTSPTKGEDSSISSCQRRQLHHKLRQLRKSSNHPAAAQDQKDRLNSLEESIKSRPPPTRFAWWMLSWLSLHFRLDCIKQRVQKIGRERRDFINN